MNVVSAQVEWGEPIPSCGGRGVLDPLRAEVEFWDPLEPFFFYFPGALCWESYSAHMSVSYDLFLKRHPKMILWAFLKPFFSGRGGSLGEVWEGV